MEVCQPLEHLQLDDDHTTDDQIHDMPAICQRLYGTRIFFSHS